MKPRPTMAQIEAALRAELLKPDTILRYGELTGCYGQIEWKNGKRIITVDLFRCALPTIIHELLHQVMQKQLAAWGQLEEPINEAADMTVSAYVEGSERRMKWWRDTIKAKDPAGEE